MNAAPAPGVVARGGTAQLAARSRIAPQPGPQEAFLASSADIAIAGGAAGGGKSFGLLLETLRHVANPDFGAVIFRRTYPQITNEGGLWDTSEKIFPRCGARPNLSHLSWRFPGGGRVGFAHLQYEQDRFQWDGAQIPLLGFDQLEHFAWRQFTYLLGRNRTTCGVAPYVRATCNPDPDHWLRRFLAWWIDDATGLAIPERSGVVRYFVIRNDTVTWASTREALVEEFGPTALPLSFTFIPSTVEDNPILLAENPEYLANLDALQRVDRERLRFGNWNVRDTAGSFFRREWMEVVDAAPGLTMEVRYWDRAATRTKPDGSAARASWTVGLRMGRSASGVFYVTDVVRFQGTPLAVEKAIQNIASQDGRGVTVWIEQDPGQAGKAEAAFHVRNLAGLNVRVNPVREAKGVRARPLSAQAEAGNVKVARGAWNDAFFDELENFDGTDRCVSDQVDAASGAFFALATAKRVGTWASA